jgi:uncharacterized damage-inducible protein DinB
MSTREFFAARLASELPAFNRVLRALPGDRLDYKPHERSTAAGALAHQIAQEMEHLNQLFNTSEIHFALTDAPTSLEEIASACERSGAAAAERMKNVGDDLWDAPARFYMNGKVAWETQVSQMAWGYLFDLIHHRGQLSTYIRPMGGKVPSIYGPSADSES